MFSKPFTAVLVAAMCVSCARARSKSSKRRGKSSKTGKETGMPTLNLPNEYEPLQQPEQIRSKRGKAKVTLNYDVVKYIGPSYDAILNLYNGNGPGPTIRLKPGDDMHIELINNLEGGLGHMGHNDFQLPNTTNLHTHGPHVSGMAPGDDIFVRIDPQESHKYEYTIGTDHMPGTHWYHPHFHGSTALQTGQGAAGLIIIEDPDDYPLPEYIKTMPEVEMVLQNLNLHEHIRQAAAESEFYLSFQEGDGLNTTNTTTDITNLVLVNMQYVPKLEMQAGKWYRWRMVLSSYFDSIAMRLKEESDCEFQLLAKDGIYLTDAPRSVPGIILSPGNRADVAVRCNKIGHTKVLSFDPYLEPAQSGISFAQDNFRPFSNFNMQPEIMLLDVVSSEEDTDEDIEHFDLQRPCYLVDLTDVDASEIEKNFTVSLHCHDLPVCRNLTINGKQWENKDTYLETFSLGRVQEITLPANPVENTGFGAWHPYHQHVNPFQIIDIDFESTQNLYADRYTLAWYKNGDWHDTIMYSRRATFPAVTIRFQTDKFSGHMVQHCHLLNHEDHGMMAQYDIVGEEGSVWQGAREIDPMCIRAEATS